MRISPQTREIFPYDSADAVAKDHRPTMLGHHQPQQEEPLPIESQSISQALYNPERYFSTGSQTPRTVARHAALEPLPVDSLSVSRQDEEKDLFVNECQISPAIARYVPSSGCCYAEAHEHHPKRPSTTREGPKLFSAAEILGLGSDAAIAAWELFVESEQQANPKVTEVALIWNHITKASL